VVKVSKGNLVEVPSVTGQSEADAKANLKAKGFSVQVVRQVAPDSQVGTVISQNPQGGQQRPNNSTVTITVGQAAPSSSPSDTGSPSPSPTASGTT
jgi:serine/threonine-protein kinase